jgi:nitroreductase
MLMACARGLGTCPRGVGVRVRGTTEAKADVGIPAEQEVVAPIIVGVPSGIAPVVGRKPPEIVSWR